MKKIIPIVFTLILLTGISGVSYESVFAQTPAPVSTPENFKVAFIGDQGLTSDSESVLTLINNENVDMVLHQGDFDYSQNPTAWNNQINAFLPGVPYFGSVGNHDLELDKWPEYQQILQNRLDSTPGAVCTGDLGVNSSCHYQGLFFILSGVGTLGSGHETYIQNELAADDSIWSICSWHKNQNAMQVGGKTNATGWGAYEACRQGGAIIATAHEHSYERTKTLTSTTNQVVDPAWTNPNEVRVAEGSTFAFVSGLGGQSIRDQERCSPNSYPYGCNGEWANIYTSTQGAQSGALFCEFNVNGQEDKAACYFKNISGQTVDTFNITSFMGVEIPQEPPVAYDQLVSTFENSPKDITLVATDANGDSLTFSIVSSPTNGSLTGTAPDLTYAPNSDYSGSDSFTFKANDGTSDSNTATVSITVNSIPTSGTLDIRVNSSSDDAEQRLSDNVMDLTSTDIEIGDDPGHNENQLGGLRFIDIIIPQGATINAAHIEFETDEVDSISTSVTIQAQDSDDTSTFTTTQNNISDRITTTALVSWNNIPAWNTVNEKHNTPDLSSLVQEVTNRSGWTPGNSMAFIIDGTGSRPAESFNGESASAALLHIEYASAPPNNPPTADDQPVSTDEDTPKAITLTASDIDGDSLTYSVVSGPSNGVLSGTAPNLTYTPDTDYNGNDSFTFTANDGTLDSNTATVTITVNSINEIHLEPITGESNTKKNWKATATLKVFDSNEIPFSAAIVSGTWQGGPTDNCTTDSQGQCKVSNTSRATSQTFTVDDISSSGITYDPTSNHNGASITINQDGGNPGPNVPPTTIDDSAVTSEDIPVNVDVLDNDSDANGDSLTVESFTQGNNGSVVDNGNGILTYAPDLGFFGSDNFSYTINDGNGETANANVNITVNEATPTASVHVDSIVMDATSANGPFWNAITTITVVDSANVVQNGVIVNADWSGSMSGSDSCTTDSLGQCSITDKSKSTLDAIFTVTNLSGVGFMYNPATNVETSDSVSPP